MNITFMNQFSLVWRAALEALASANSGPLRLIDPAA
jgi:hypothetical protein